jgi:hypothetical protein
MAYREKSAWVMGALMALSGLYYLHLVITVSGTIGETELPMRVLIAYVVLVVVGSVVAQVTLAVSHPKEANAPADERERPVLDRAGNVSGIVLGFGAVSSLLHFLYNGDGALLFHMIMGSLIVSQVVEYGLQITFLRRSA